MSPVVPIADSDGTVELLVADPYQDYPLQAVRLAIRLRDTTRATS